MKVRVAAGILASVAMWTVGEAGDSPAVPVDDPKKEEKTSSGRARSSSANGYHPSEFNISVRGGRGIIRALSPYTLDSGEVATGFHVTNFDRNPGDVDFFEFMFQAALGLPGRSEAFIRVSPTLRTNSVGQDPVGYPVPPLDLFVDTYPTTAARAQPHFLYAQEAPFKTYNVKEVRINPPGNGAFSSRSGDLVLGFKKNFASEDLGSSLGFGLRFTLEIPVEKPAYNTWGSEDDWRRYTGVSGEMDYGLDLLFSKRFWKTELLANLGYKRIGDPERGLRVQMVDSSQTDPERFLVGHPMEIGLDLHDEVDLTLGMAFPGFAVLGEQLWFMGEFSYQRYIGSGTTVERLVHPAELRLGVQVNFPWYRAVSVGVAFQLLFNDAGDGDQRTSFFVTPDGRGDINFTELVDSDLSEEVQQFMTSRGATFSYNSSKVFATNNPEFDAWRNISSAPKLIIGKGGGNALAYVTWRVGSLWGEKRSWK